MPFNHPKPLPPLSKGDIERFWSNVDKTPGQGPKDCWTWIKGRTDKGYGRACFGKQYYIASRISFLIENAVDASEQCVLHHCDNPPCVNPEHLFLGDRLANAQDAKRKGRTHSEKRRSPREALRILTAGQVLEIRQRYSDGVNPAQLSSDFGVSSGCIYYILTGRTYRDVGSVPEMRPRGWLTPEDVAKIRRLCTSGVAQKRVAEMFAIRQGHVSRIVNFVRHGQQTPVVA